MGENRASKSILILILTISIIINAVMIWKSNEMNIKYSELEQSYLELFDDPFQAPISKLKSVHISLEFGGWNNLNMKDMIVTASLKHMRFWDGDGRFGGEVLNDVVEPVSDYSPVFEGVDTYRYVWYVIVSRAGRSKSVPPPGIYLVDAATGEIVPW